MKLEFSIIFASLHRDLEASRLDGASQAAATKLRADAQTNAQTGKQLHASPKRVTSSTANLEEIASPEKVTQGDLHHFSNSRRLLLLFVSQNSRDRHRSLDLDRFI